MPEAPFFQMDTDYKQQEIAVRMDRLIYKSGDFVSVTVDMGEIHLDVPEMGVILASSRSGDTEVLILSRRENTNQYVTEKPIRLVSLDAGGQSAKMDGMLCVNAGEIFFAILGMNREYISQEVVKPDIIADMAYMYDESAKDKAPYQVMAELALTEDELDPPPGGKRIGTIVTQDGLPVQFPIDELVFYPDSERQLENFLKETKGEIYRRCSLSPNRDVPHPHNLAQDPLANDSPWTRPNENSQTQVRTGDAYLVKVSTAATDIRHLPQLRVIFGEKDRLYGSSEDVLRMYAFALHLQLRGYRVAVNPKLMLQAPPTVSEGLPTSMFNPRMGTLPGSSPILNVPQTWALVELWEKTSARINVAFLDQGFAPNADFRPRPTGGFVECDLEGGNIVDGILTGFRSGPGVATSPPTVGNSFFGGRSWHGNGVVTVAGGVINNGFGRVGVGGQVVVPMLYRFGVASYAFEIGLGIRKAVADGASVINISAGYPCSIVTNIGPDFDICSPESRLAVCAAITAALTAAVAAALGAAAAAACAAAAAAFGWIPFAGPAIVATICAAAATAAATGVAATITAATTACFALILPGDVRGVMSSAVAAALGSGVPIVSISGNNISPSSLPEVLRDIIDLSDQRLDRWMIIPASIPGVIAVGAADRATLLNAHFFGSRVDLWAPIPSPYLGPATVTAVTPGRDHVLQPEIGGTSAAAPYVTGVIALMQAVDPTLDPRSPATAGFSPSARAGIPTRIRTILTGTAFSATTLAARGFPDPSGRRRNLVNPLGAVMAVASSVVPNFAALGYDVEMNFDEPPGAERIRLLTPGESVTGTIVTIPGSGSVPTVPDIDRFEFRTPADAGLYQATFRLRTPTASRFGRLTVRGPGFTMERTTPPSPIEDEFIIRTPTTFHNTTVNFGITGFGLDDNLYKLTFEELLRVSDLPTADRFDRDDAAVNLEESRPNNNVQERAVPIEKIPGLTWETVPELLSVRRVIEIGELNFHEPGDVDWFKLEIIPDHMSTGEPDCPASLSVHVPAGVMVSVLTEDGIYIVRNRTASFSVDSRFLTVLPLYIKVEPAIPGIFTEYSLSLEYASVDDWVCRLERIMREWREAEAFEDMNSSGVFGFPREFPDLESAIPVPCLTIPRELDFAGRITSPDLYAIRWSKDGDFHLAAWLTSGNSIRMRLITATGEVLAQASSLSLRSGYANLSRCGPDYDGELISLRRPALPQGDYVLAISHGFPNTTMDIRLPQDAAREGSPVIEDFRNRPAHDH